MTAEIASDFIILAFAIVNCYQGFRYMRQLHLDMLQDNWIQDDKLHSQQHFAITGCLSLLSLVMAIVALRQDTFPEQFMIFLAYNFVCLLIVYPHLMSEK